MEWHESFAKEELICCYFCCHVPTYKPSAPAPTVFDLWVWEEDREQAAVLGVTLNNRDNIWECANVAMDLLEVSHCWTHCWTQAWLWGLTPWEMSRKKKKRGGGGRREKTFRPRSHQAWLGQLDSGVFTPLVCFLCIKSPDTCAQKRNVIRWNEH